MTVALSNVIYEYLIPTVQCMLHYTDRVRTYLGEGGMLAQNM